MSFGIGRVKHLSGFLSSFFIVHDNLASSLLLHFIKVKETFEVEPFDIESFDIESFDIESFEFEIFSCLRDLILFLKF